jgi:hypothetical protein
MAGDLTYLLRLAEQTGDDSILDELVHDRAQDVALAGLNEIAGPAEQDEHIAAIEAQASEINNAGFERQIEYLLRAGASAETIEAVLQGNG